VVIGAALNQAPLLLRLTPDSLIQEPLFRLDVEGKNDKDGVIGFEGLPTKPRAPSPWICDVDAWTEITVPER
jgi:hypothetical protein